MVSDVWFALLSLYPDWRWRSEHKACIIPLAKLTVRGSVALFRMVSLDIGRLLTLAESTLPPETKESKPDPSSRRHPSNDVTTVS